MLATFTREQLYNVASRVTPGDIAMLRKIIHSDPGPLLVETVLEPGDVAVVLLLEELRSPQLVLDSSHIAMIMANVARDLAAWANRCNSLTDSLPGSWLLAIIDNEYFTYSGRDDFISISTGALVSDSKYKFVAVTIDMAAIYYAATRERKLHEPRKPATT